MHRFSTILAVTDGQIDGHVAVAKIALAYRRVGKKVGCAEENMSVLLALEVQMYLSLSTNIYQIIHRHL